MKMKHLLPWERRQKQDVNLVQQARRVNPLRLRLCHSVEKKHYTRSNCRYGEWRYFDQSACVGRLASTGFARTWKMETMPGTIGILVMKHESMGSHGIVPRTRATRLTQCSSSTSGEFATVKQGA